MSAVIWVGIGSVVLFYTLLALKVRENVIRANREEWLDQVERDALGRVSAKK